MTTPNDETLSPEAELACAFYQAMGLTKNFYFSFLQALDQKYEKNESPSIAENLKLEQLLKAHDEGVKAFKAAMTRVEDPRAREVLLNKLSTATSTLGTH